MNILTIIIICFQKSPSTTPSSNTITTNGKSGPESPKMNRKRINSSCEETSPRVNGLGGGDSSTVDMDRLKDEILDEVRKELHKCKQEIIEGKYTPLSHYSILVRLRL